MSSACKEEEDLFNNPEYISYTTTSFFASVISLVFSFMSLERLRHVQLSGNIKLLITYYIFTHIALASTVLANYGWYLERFFHIGPACDVVLVLSRCKSIRYAFLASFISITLSHVTITVDKFYATIRPKVYDSLKNRNFAIFLIILNVAISSAVAVAIMMQENIREFVPQCFSFSATDIGAGVYIMFATQLFVEALVLGTQKFLLFINNQRHWKTYSLTREYQAAENRRVLRRFSPNFYVSSFIILAYNVLALIFRRFQNDMTKNIYILGATIIFVIPYLPLILSTLCLRMLNKHIDGERRRFEELMASWNKPFNLEEQWNTAYNATHPTGISMTSTSRNPFKLPKRKRLVVKEEESYNTVTEC